MLQASQTGHLVFSSIHAFTPLAVLQRLYHLGIHHHDLIEHLKLIISQRIIHQASKTFAQFEFLEITDQFRQLVLKSKHPMQIRMEM